MALALALTGVRPAAADSPGPPWLRIERLEAAPSVVEDHVQLRLHVTAVNLQGVFLDDITGARAWSLKFGRQKKTLPYISGRFDGLEDELAVAVVIATTPAFDEVLPAIKSEVGRFLDKLPRRQTQAVIIGYDDAVHGSRRLFPLARALRDLEKLEVSQDPGEEALLRAMDQARRAVSRARPSTPGTPVRRMIVVISDGRDASYPEPDGYRLAGRRAAREGIPIHSIAYAPDSNRLPLRGLGELSRRSSGTFRFAYTRAGFGSHFEQLTKEVLGQYVLTFLVPAEDVVGKRIGLVASATGMESGDVRVSQLRCGGEACEASQYCLAHACVTRSQGGGRGVLGWLFLLAGVAVGLVLLLMIVGLIMAWLERRRSTAALLAPAQPAPAEPPAVADPHRIVAQGPHGERVQPAAPRGASQGHAAVAPTGGHAALPPSGAHRVIPPTGGHAALPPSGAHRVIPPTGGHAVAPGHAAPARAPAQASLLILKGPLQGQRIPLHHGFLIGKAPGCHLHLVSDSFASGHHARILMDERGGFTLVDQSSTNGTFVNGVRTMQSRLSHGMLITIGSTEARFLAQ